MLKNSRINGLEQDLRQYLAFGPWKINEKLPPEESFMERFGVSRSMLREAMKTLSAEGIVVKRHGSGTYLQYIPKKCIELFVRLDNIVSPAGVWYRWQIEQLKQRCRLMDIDLEVLVSHGDTHDEIAASFNRHLSRPMTSELVGSAVLFYCPDLERRLAERGGRFVTVSLFDFDRFRGAAVVLDYCGMGKAMAQSLEHSGAKRPALFYVDDPPELEGADFHRRMRGLFDAIVPDRGDQVGIPSLEQADAFMLEWFSRRAGEHDCWVFTDDSIARQVLKLAAELPWLAGIPPVITHANAGGDLPAACRAQIIGFDRETVARAIWSQLFEADSRRKIMIEPVNLGQEKTA